MKRRTSTTKSLADLMKTMRGLKEQKRMRKPKKGGDEGFDSSLQELYAMQQQAIQAEMENAEGITQRAYASIKGLQKAYELEEEYKVARTGIRSKAGKIAKALGLSDARSAAQLDKIFGKRVQEEELKRLREKFKMKSEEEKKREKAAKVEESKNKVEKRNQQLNDISRSVGKIYGMVNHIRLSVEGIANKLKASQAKEVVARKGQYFSPEGKRIKKGNIEKQAGLKYSRETGRYHDIKSRRMVAQEEAERRMNLSQSAKKMGRESTLESKTLNDPSGEGSIVRMEREIGSLEKKIGGLNRGLDQITHGGDLFSLLKPIFGIIGGATGAGVAVTAAFGRLIKSFVTPENVVPPAPPQADAQGRPNQHSMRNMSPIGGKGPNGEPMLRDRRTGETGYFRKSDNAWIKADRPPAAAPPAPAQQPPAPAQGSQQKPPDNADLGPGPQGVTGPDGEYIYRDLRNNKTGYLRKSDGVWVYYNPPPSAPPAAQPKPISIDGQVVPGVDLSGVQGYKPPDFIQSEDLQEAKVTAQKPQSTDPNAPGYVGNYKGWTWNDEDKKFDKEKPKAIGIGYAAARARLAEQIRQEEQNRKPSETDEKLEEIQTTVERIEKRVYAAPLTPVNIPPKAEEFPVTVPDIEVPYIPEQRVRAAPEPLIPTPPKDEGFPVTIPKIEPPKFDTGAASRQGSNVGVTGTTTPSINVQGLPALAAELISKKEGLGKGYAGYWDPEYNIKGERVAKVSIGHGHQITEEERAQGYIQVGKEQIALKGELGKETVLTPAQAKTLLAQDVPKYSTLAKNLVGNEVWNKLSDHQKSVLTDYVYQAGPQLFKDTILKAGFNQLILRGDFAAAAKLFKPAFTGVDREGNFIKGEGVGSTIMTVEDKQKELQMKDGKKYFKQIVAPGLVDRRNTEVQEFLTPDSPTPPPTPTSADGMNAAPGPSALNLNSSTNDLSDAIRDASSNQGEPTVIAPIVASTGPTKTLPPNNSRLASARMTDNSYNRAISNDFAHPSSFSTMTV